MSTLPKGYEHWPKPARRAIPSEVNLQQHHCRFYGAKPEWWTFGEPPRWADCCGCGHSCGTTYHQEYFEQQGVLL